MVRAGQERRGSRRDRRAFTLLEVLLALALVSLLGGFLVMDWAGLAGSFARPSPREALQEAFRSAHYLAERRERATWIRAGEEGGFVEVIDPEGGAVLLRQEIPGLESLRAVEGAGSIASPVRSLRLRGREGGAVVRIGPEGVAEGRALAVGLGGRVHSLVHDPFSGALLREDGQPWGASRP